MAINALCELAGGPEKELSEMMVGAVVGSARRFEALLAMGVARGELPAATDCHGKALALQSLLVGINVMSKAVRAEAELWLTARTTLDALGLLEESDGRYALSAPAEDYLLESSPTYFGGYFELMIRNYSMYAFESVKAAVLTDAPQLYGGEEAFASQASAAAPST